MRTETRAGAASVAALVACILSVHALSLSGPGGLTAHHDNLDGAAPLRVEAARQWKSGNVPLWNPWKRAGMPLLADTTAGAIYPGNLPFLFAADPEAGENSSVFRALDQVAAINAVLGGLFMFVFLRALALARVASVFGGIVWACCGTMEWFAAWYIQIQSSAVWLPLILAAVQGASDARAAKWTTIGALAVALQFFAGFPETSFYSGVLAIAFALTVAAQTSSLRPVVSVVRIYAFGMLLAGVQLFPSLELQSLARRPGELPLEVSQALPATTEMLGAWVIPLTESGGFEFPPLAAYYFGAIAVLAAAVGVLFCLRRTAFFVAVLAVGFVLSLGAVTPVSAWLHELPVFSAFRHPFKHLFELSFAMSVLAAFGMQRLLGGFESDGRAARATPIRLATAMVGIAVTCVLLFWNILVVGATNPPGFDPHRTRPPIVTEIEPGWRVLAARQVFQKRSPRMLIGDYPSQFGVAAIHGAGPFLWSPLAKATGMVEEEIAFRPGLFDARDRALALLSGRYLVQTKQKVGFTPKVDAPTWSVVSESLEVRLVERRDALPRYRFVGEVYCATASEIDESLRGNGVSPNDVALIDCGGPARKAFPSEPPAVPEVRVVSEEAAHIVLETSVPGSAGAFLVLSQSDFPGWRAWVDGKSTVIRRVHGLVQGIELPIGAMRVELRYLPVPFFAGVATSATTAVLLAVWMLVAARRRE